MTQTEPLAPLHCQTCRAVLGWTDGRRLESNGIYVVTATTIHCAECGQRRRWIPNRHNCA